MKRFKYKYHKDETEFDTNYDLDKESVIKDLKNMKGDFIDMTIMYDNHEGYTVEVRSFDKIKESDEEYKKRLLKKEAIKKEKEIQKDETEKAEYERLKKKYG